MSRMISNRNTLVIVIRAKYLDNIKIKDAHFGINSQFRQAQLS